MPIHRTIKNVVHNYTYAEVKVREATSNDPWGPASSLMSEIAQLTNNPLAYNEVMAMIWRRMNDHGKNWRHVYKSLMLLEYLMKHGSERVSRECRANIVAIRTLADFQQIDENGRDNGQAVREKARQLALLLGDDERLRSERIRAYDAQDRSASSRDDRDGVPISVTRYEKYPTPSGGNQQSREAGRSSENPEIDTVRPTSSGEEELQLQLALALSKEEHEEQLKRQKADDLKLQMAIEESKKTAASSNQSSRSQKSSIRSPGTVSRSVEKPSSASLLDGPLDSVIKDPWAPLVYSSKPVNSSKQQRDPWADLVDMPQPSKVAYSDDPWSTIRTSSPVPAIYSDIQRDMPTTTLAPWEEVEAKMAANNGTFHTNARSQTQRSQPAYDADSEFAALSVRQKNGGSKVRNGVEVGNDLLDMSSDTFTQIDSFSDLLKPTTSSKKMTPEDFLGPNAKLVDFDDLVAKPTTQSNINPFAMTVGKPSVANPFVTRAKEEELSKRVPINQMSAGQMTMGSAPLVPSTVFPNLTVAYPPQPLPPQQGYNPFL